MFRQIIGKLLWHSENHKRLFVMPAIFIILMIIAISFSQVAMEIYAYAFIANKQVEQKNVESLIELKKAQQTFRNQQSEQNTKKVNNHKKSTDDTGVIVNNSDVNNTNAKSSVLSFIKPIEGGITSSLYGDTFSRRVKHLGHDWAVETGTKVVASAEGVVERAYYSTSYGYNILINHGKGIKTRYAHLSKIGVTAGQHVKQKQTIGFSGNTGDSTGPHLHFEVIVNGKCSNPLNYIQ